jgi:MFS family permease
MNQSHDPRRWWALALLGTVFFMVILDGTIVFVALPTIQEELGFSTYAPVGDERLPPVFRRLPPLGGERVTCSADAGYSCSASLSSPHRRSSAGLRRQRRR